MQRQDNKTVCICIPTYNSSATLAQTVDSLLVQSFTNFKLFIVDNASADATLALAEEYAARDSRVRVIAHRENVGAEGNFSRCIDYACGDYTCIFHSDDLYAPDILEKEVAYLDRHPAAGAVFCSATYIDKQGSAIGTGPVPREIKDADDDREYSFADLYPLILRDMNFFVCPSAMVRTEIYQRHVGTWDGGRFASSADLWVWLRILEKYTIGFLSPSLINYRISTFQGGAMLRRLKTRPADFFLVTEYYNAQPWVQSLLTEKVRRNYAFIQAIDRYTRTVNSLILGDRLQARSLTSGFWQAALLKSAFNPDSPAVFGTHRLRYWCYFVIFWCLSRIPGSVICGPVLRRLRYGRCHD